MQESSTQQKYRFTEIVLWIALLLFAGIPATQTVEADSITVSSNNDAYISNTISVTSNSGNSRVGDTRSEGKSSASVFVETVHNGEVIEHIDETVTSETGSASISVDVENRVDKERSTSSVQISTSSQTIINSSAKQTVTSTQRDPHTTDTSGIRVDADATTSVSLQEPLISLEEDATTTQGPREHVAVHTRVANFFHSLVTYVFSLFSKQTQQNHT